MRSGNTLATSFGLSNCGEVYLRAEKEEITLKQGAIEMCFPLIRWKMFETYLDDIDEAVHCNRYDHMVIID
jgi:hypothetical protein